MASLQVLPPHRRLAATANDIHESVKTSGQVLMPRESALLKIYSTAHQECRFLCSHIPLPDDPTTTCNIASALPISVAPLSDMVQTALHALDTSCMVWCGYALCSSRQQQKANNISSYAPTAYANHFGRIFWNELHTDHQEVSSECRGQQHAFGSKIGGACYYETLSSKIHLQEWPSHAKPLLTLTPHSTMRCFVSELLQALFGGRLLLT